VSSGAVTSGDVAVEGYDFQGTVTAGDGSNQKGGKWEQGK